MLWNLIHHDAQSFSCRFLSLWTFINWVWYLHFYIAVEFAVDFICKCTILMPWKVVLMVRLMVLEATYLLSSIVLLSRPQRLAQSSSHYQILSCYLCQYMSYMLTVEILIADSLLSGLNFAWCILFIDILLHGICCFSYVWTDVLFVLFFTCIHSN